MTRLLFRCAVLAFVLTGTLAIGEDWIWPGGQGGDASQDMITGSLGTAPGLADGASQPARPIRVILPGPPQRNLSEP